MKQLVSPYYFATALLGLAACTIPPAPPASLWGVYTQSLAQAKYVDLTHPLTPQVPVLAAFGHPTFICSTNLTTGHAYDY